MPKEARVILYAVLIFSIALAVLTIFRYWLTLHLKKKRNFGGQSNTLFSREYLIPMCVEIFLIMLIPYPWLIGKTVEVETLYGSHIIYYHYNEIIQFFSALRVLVVIRVFLLSSVWNSNRCQRLCKIYGVKSGALFALKAMIATQPALIITLTYLFSIPYFGYMLRLAERPTTRIHNNKMIYNYANSMWNIVEAMTVVGFGDFYPKTLLGRMVISIVSIWGTVILSLFVVTATKFLDMSILERKVFMVMGHFKVKKRLKVEAANLIKTWLQIHFLRQKAKTVPDRTKTKFRAYFASFQKISRQYRDHATSIDDVQEMRRQFKLVQRRMNLVSRQFQFITHVNQLLEKSNRLKFNTHKTKKIEERAKPSKNLHEERKCQS